MAKALVRDFEGRMNESMDRLRVLYAEHGPALLRYLRRLTGRGDWAEDLLQETFVQALKGPERLDAAASPKAWLFAIARHLGINAVQRRREVAPLVEEVAAPEAERPDPRRDEMREAIAGLPEKQREALQLRLGEGLSYEEIARVLEVPVGTVRSRLHAGVRVLRELLGREGEL
jgi:RNA polymerase sigma-70 factor (ECF subfamily)